MTFQRSLPCKLSLAKVPEIVPLITVKPINNRWVGGWCLVKQNGPKTSLEGNHDKHVSGTHQASSQ